MIAGIAETVAAVTGDYANPPGVVWLFATLFRTFVVTQIMLKSYDGRGAPFCVGEDQPGCEMQCIINYEPVSLGIFWAVSLISVMVPFLIFNMALNFIKNKNEINNMKNVPQTWMTKTRSLKRKSGRKEVLWSPLIATTLITKLCTTFVIELISLFIFGKLQCYKFPEHVTGGCDDFSLVALYARFRTLTVVPEGFNCNVQDFGRETWFGNTRDVSVCQAVNSGMNCWVPRSVEKTVLNRVMVAFNMLGVMSMFAEIIWTIIVLSWRRETDDSKLKTDDPALTSPLSYHVEERYLESDDEPPLFEGYEVDLVKSRKVE